MKLSIKAKLVFLGIGVIAALAVLAFLVSMSGDAVKQAMEANSRRLERYELARDLELRGTRLMLAAAGAMVDRESGDISTERMQTMKQNAAFLEDSIPALGRAADSQEVRQRIQALEARVRELDQLILDELARLIRGSAERSREIDKDFAQLSQTIDELRNALLQKFETLEQEFEDEGFYAGQQLVWNASKSLSDLVLAAKDSIIDRREGSIAQERWQTITTESERLLATIRELRFRAGPAKKELTKPVAESFEKLAPLLTQRLKVLVEQGATEQTRIQEAFADIETRIGDLGDEVLADLAPLAAGIREELHRSNEQLRATMAEASRTQLTIFLVAGVLLALFLVFFVRDLSRALTRVLAYASEVAGGNLDAAQPLRRKDEIGRVADSVGAMAENLKTKILEAQKDKQSAENQAELARRKTSEAEEACSRAEQAKVEGLHQAAAELEGPVQQAQEQIRQLTRTMEQARDGASTQQMRLEEVAGAMDGMNHAVAKAAGNAADAVDSADTTREHAQNGAQVVSQAVQAIENVNREAGALDASMQELGSLAEDISDVMHVITDIADQTNLLALNAAIEAARAGEAGRGFAVVADEVRKLAEKTMHATKEVGDKIHSIQQAAKTNARGVESAVAAVQNVMDLATASGEALEEIVRLADIAADQIRSIATATEEQSATTDRINQSLNEVRNISEDTAQGMTGAARVSDELRQSLGHVQDLMHRLGKS